MQIYVERIKPYEYRLMCGFIFSSDTLSVAEQGSHFFPCRRCNDWHVYQDDELPGLQREAASARDMAQVSRLDKAILKDRIVKDLRESWNLETYQCLATKHGVSRLTVIRIANELGVSDYGTPHDMVSTPS